MIRSLSSLIAFASLTVVGCESSSTLKPTPAPNFSEVAKAPETIEPVTKPKATASAVTLEVKSWDETLALVAQHKGKVVVLDLWSTSCEPCMVEFPHLVELHKQHGDKLVCLSASCDYAGIKSKPPESYRERVLEFLTKKNATFPNVLLNVESDVLFEKIELASIPAVYIFNADGKIAKRFDNDNAKTGEDFTYTKDILPFVEKLLSE